MSNLVAVEKDPDYQRRVPSAWRPTFSAIVSAFKDADFQLSEAIPGVPTLTSARAESIRDNLEGYGAKLIDLPDAAWDTSVCQWMGSYWDVLVDLFTETEGASDLVLSVRVRELNSDYTFDVLSVYVP